MSAQTNGTRANVFIRLDERQREAATQEVVMTKPEVARLLRLRPSTVAEMARRGDLPSVMLGRNRRYLQADILDWLDGQRDRPSRGF